MHRGEQTPIGTQVTDCIQNIHNEFQNNPSFRRVLSVALAIAQLGLVTAGIKNIESEGDVGAMCGIEITCYLELAALDTPGVTENAETTTTTIAPVATTEVPTTVPAATIPPTTVPVTIPPVLATTQPPVAIEAAANTEELSSRGMSYEKFLANFEIMLNHIPTLDELNQLAPHEPMFQKVPEQKQRIAELDAAIVPTAEKYHSLFIDQSRNQAFTDMPSYHVNITPRAFIIHWTGDGYIGGVDTFIVAAKSRQVRSEFFINKDAETYQLFETDNNMPAHGISINSFSQGVEIETGEYDHINSPLFSYTPQQLENAVYVAVNFLRRNNLPVDHTTLLGHYAADLIFQNPHYDPLSGIFNSPKIRKQDPPQELMNVLIAKAQALDTMLGPR